MVFNSHSFWNLPVNLFTETENVRSNDENVVSDDGHNRIYGRKGEIDNSAN